MRYFLIFWLLAGGELEFETTEAACHNVQQAAEEGVSITLEMEDGTKQEAWAVQCGAETIEVTAS